MKRTIYFLVLIIFIVSTVWIFQNIIRKEGLDEGKPIILPVERFIIQHLLHDDGTIRTNVELQDGSELALSESLGLWMEYLAEKEDSLRFKDAYDTLINKFLLKEGVIAWKIEVDEIANTNALIDDMRIMKALFLEGERTGNKDYIETATKIAKSIVMYNRHGEHFVDFYDTDHRYANEEITLSYLDIEGFRYLSKYELISEESIKVLERFMIEIPSNNGFFPKSYRVVTHTFQFDEMINLIDQVYTAIHLEKAGATTDEFYEWLKEEFYKENLLYGRYDRETKKRSVEYESASVYALTILYSLEKNDTRFAKDVYERMLTMQVHNQESQYYGGYVTSENVTHSFDNLFPLIAERKLFDEQVVN